MRVMTSSSGQMAETSLRSCVMGEDAGGTINRWWHGRCEVGMTCVAVAGAASLSQSSEGGSGAEQPFDASAQGAHVGATLDLGFDDGHDLAHVLHAGRARAGNGRADQ